MGSFETHSLTYVNYIGHCLLSGWMNVGGCGSGNRDNVGIHVGRSRHLRREVVSVDDCVDRRDTRRAAYDFTERRMDESLEV